MTASAKLEYYNKKVNSYKVSVRTVFNVVNKLLQKYQTVVPKYS